jgi:O-antigen ligase
MFVFTIPWETAIQLPGLGSAARLTGIIAFVGGIAHVILRARLRRLDVFHILVLLFFLWCTVTYFWSTDRTLTAQRLQEYYQLFSMIWIIWQLSDSYNKHNWLLQAYVLGCVVSAVGIIYDARIGVSYIGTFNTARYSSFGADPNETALTLALGVPLAWYMLSRTQGLLFILNLAYIPVAALSVILTASRGGAVCFAVSLLIIPWTFRFLRRQLKFLVGCICCISVAILPSFVPFAAWSRIMTLSDELSGGDFHYRKIIWAAGLEVFRNHSILGVGSGAYAAAIQFIYTNIVAHNTFLSILVEDGLVGFVLFLAVIIRLVVAVFRLKGEARAVWTVVLLTWSVGVFALTWDYRKPTWLMFSLVICAEVLKRHANLRVNSRETTSGRVGEGLGSAQYT